MGRVIKGKNLADRPSPIEPDAKKAAQVLARAQVEAAELRRLARRSVIELSLRMAEKIVGETAKMRPEVLDRLYREALSNMPEAPEGTIAVHPLDRGPGGVDALVEGRGFKVVEDESVGRGGVRVAAGSVSVDASLSAALEAIEKAVSELSR